MRTVYALQSGGYDDYTIVVFEREHDAKAAVDMGSGDHYQPMVLMEAGELPYRTTVHRAKASISLAPNTGSAEPHITASEQWVQGDVPPACSDVDEYRAATHINVTADGTDPDAVLKAVAERYAQLRNQPT